MKIVGAKYITEDNSIIAVTCEIGTVIFVPNIEDNRHRKLVTEWQKKGGVIFSYTSPWAENFELWMDSIVRPKRDSKLSISDKYILLDYPISNSQKELWLVYRQTLRDLPTILTEIVDPIPWPKEPV